MNITKNNLKYCIFTSLILSTGWVLYLYPLSFLQGRGHYFDVGDASQHLSGWLSYYSDKWHYPLLYTNLINYPEGVSIAFLDSIPLVAVLFKIIKILLPEHFHYFGLWHAVAYLSQGIASVILVRAAGFKSFFASLVAIIFGLSSPVLLFRIAHTALMTQSLILFSLANYFYFVNGKQTFSKASNIQIAILFCSFLIHPYFFALNFVFLLTIFCIAFQKDKNFFPIIRKTIFLTLLMGMIFFAFGYNAKNTQTFGFGFFSLNLLAPFLSHDATGGQYEGYNYLGLGIISLLLVNIIFNRKIIFQQIKKHCILIIFFIFLTLFAISNKIYLGDFKIFEYDLPNILTPITNTFRASGRFFWPPFYFITFVILFGILSLSNKKLSVICIVIAMIIQIVDLNSLRAQIRETTRKASNVPAADWKEILASVDGLIIFPFYEHGILDPEAIMKYQKIASQFSKFTNTSLIARYAMNYENKIKFINEFNPEKALYIIQIKDIEKKIFYYPPFSSMYDLLVNENCPIQEDFILCRKGATREWWINHIGPCEFYSNKFIAPNTVSFNAIDLPTQVGVSQKTFLVSEKDNSGFLSFGPYIPLKTGKYKATIDFMSSNNVKDDVGFWDVNVFSQDIREHKTLVAMNIINTDNQPSTMETIFEVTPELNNAEFEIRTFFNGKGQLTLKSIMLEKL